MNRLEHLLTIAAEECAELAQGFSKANRFGLFEVEPGQALSNLERIQYEFNDLLATMVMLQYEGDLLELQWIDTRQQVAKQERVERFLEYSKSVGRLEFNRRDGR